MKKLLVRGIAVLLAMLFIIPTGIVFASAEQTGTPFTYVTGANSVSDSYAGSRFYEYLTKLTITGDQRTDLVAVALTQAGYMESSTAGDFSGTNQGYRDYCEYNYNMGDFGSGYGNPYHWCASFVSWALLQSRCYELKLGSMSDWARYHDGDDDILDTSYMWREVGCGFWVDQLNRAGYYKKSQYRGGDYTPQTGDIIFFSWDGTSRDHVGIVIYTDGVYVYTVEGNTSDANGLEDNGGCCAVKSYSIGSSNIHGYGAMPYKSNEDAKIDFSGKNRTTGYYINTEANKYIYSDENCTSGTEIGIISRFTMFEVTKICGNGMLKVNSELNDGTTATGYIDPAASRVFQLTSNSASTEDIELENNAAAGKAYTTSELYRQGDADVYWEYDESKPITYDDENGVSLTDGAIAANGQYTNDAWAGLHHKTPDAAEAGYAWMTVDLGDVYDITKCMLYVPVKGLDTGAGVTRPDDITFWASIDGTEYMQIGIASYSTANDYTAIAELECAATAQYIQARIVHGGWIFISEMAVIGTVADDSNIPEYPVTPVYDIDFILNGRGTLNINNAADGTPLAEITGGDEAASQSVSVSEDIGFTVVPDEGWVVVGVYGDETAIELSENNIIAPDAFTSVTVTLAPVPEAPDTNGMDVGLELNADEKTFTATVPYIENGLYSFDGINFSEINTKTDCTENTEYTVYIKIVDPEYGLESEASAFTFVSPMIPFMLGDINDSGDIDMMDYILLKRNYFGTFGFDEEQFKRGDINGNAEIDMMDYILLKRVYFGTYSLTSEE